MEEMFDVTDEYGNPVGTLVKRSEAHERGILHRTSHVWIVRKNNGSYDVLLQKRSAEKESFPSMYDTSSAGHIRAGDEPLESAIRELKEELGITAKPDELYFAGRIRIKYESVFHGKLFRDNEVAFVFIYNENVDENKLVLQKEEVEEVRWFPAQVVLEGIGHRNGLFCVPLEGLKTAMNYLIK